MGLTSTCHYPLAFNLFCGEELANSCMLAHVSHYISSIFILLMFMFILPNWTHTFIIHLCAVRGDSGEKLSYRGYTSRKVGEPLFYLKELFISYSSGPVLPSRSNGFACQSLLPWPFWQRAGVERSVLIRFHGLFLDLLHV